MNEIKKIHLGRQPFTISTEAHRVLRGYLEAIGNQVGTKSDDVLKEIELRMAELLTERGITADKVVLLEDVEFLQEQLGKPGDFKDDSSHSEQVDDAKSASVDDDGIRRLYRDTNTAMIAGVASGLAAYFHIDALIVRLLFVVLTLTGGAGILMYILLWVLVPEAKTPSERLQMRGKAVTVDNLKKFVDRADVPAAADRVGRGVGRLAELVAKIVLGFIGIAFAVAGIVIVICSIVVGIYMLAHGGQVGVDTIFPVGTKEIIALLAGLVAAAMIGLTLTFIGIAMVNRKWKMPTWATASVVGLFFVGASVATVLGINTLPAIRQRYQDARKTETRSVTAFKKVDLAGDDVHYTFRKSNTYSVDISYVGDLKDKRVTTTVAHDVLNVNVPKLKHQVCIFFCFNDIDDISVTISAPSLESIKLIGNDTSFFASDVITNKDLLVEARRENQVSLAYMKPEDVRVSFLRNDRASRLLEIYNARSDQAGMDDIIELHDEYVTIGHAERVELKTWTVCEEPILWLRDMPLELRINDSEVVKSAADLLQLQDREVLNDYNCVKS